MLKGIHLSVLVGPIVVAPLPRIALDALQSVQVTQSGTDGGDAGFELKFAFSSRSPLNTLFLIAGAQHPLLRVILVATIDATPLVLMDGIMTHYELQPVASGSSTLTILGKDLTTVMNRQDFGGLPYPALPIEARVALIVAKYAPLGLIPLIVPSAFSDVSIPIDKIPTHEGTDLEYVKRLARELGYVFYIDPGPLPGMNTAYFGPPVKIGVPQRALNIDMDAHTNVESLSFRFETGEAGLPIVFIQNSLTRMAIPIPIPKLNPLQPPLGLIPAPMTKLDVLRDTAKLPPMKALAAGVAAAAKMQDAVKGTGTLDVMRYGRPLRPRGLVGVRGAGLAFDGLYYVEKVTTTLKPGDFKQSFSLSRNGIVSLTPVVPA